MNKLFNEKVISAQPVTRDLSSSASGGMLPATHSGTKITTASGGEYLIHHGDGYAAPGSNPTVITDARNMSSNWKSVGTSYQPNTTVGGMMGTGQSYNMFSHNCHDVTAGMPNSSVKTSTSFYVSTDIKPK